jgi:hypothetical protein
MRQIEIKGNGFKLDLEVEFFDNSTAKEILKNLPLSSTVNLWGEEIYFDIGIKAPVENPTTDVNIKDVAYWPQGKCLCIFFGPTPLSGPDKKPVPASEVVIVGKLNNLPSELKEVKSGYKITVK